jgi:hypothetical protein
MQVHKILQSCINCYELFFLNDGKITSNRVNRNIEKRRIESESKRDAAFKRWNKDAGAMQVNAGAMQVNAKERKGNEIKGKESVGDDGITAEDIYAAYPKKVDKGHAIPAIKKAMNKVQPAELLRCVQAYSGSVKGKTERKFIPNPSTWFNGERWADDDVKVIADRDLSTMPWDDLVVLYKQHRPANCPTTNGLSMPREQIEERLAKILTEKGI